MKEHLRKKNRGREGQYLVGGTKCCNRLRGNSGTQKIEKNVSGNWRGIDFIEETWGK